MWEPATDVAALEVLHTSCLQNWQCSALPSGAVTAHCKRHADDWQCTTTQKGYAAPSGMSTKQGHFAVYCSPEGHNGGASPGGVNSDVRGVAGGIVIDIGDHCAVDVVVGSSAGVASVRRRLVGIGTLPAGMSTSSVKAIMVRQYMQAAALAKWHLSQHDFRVEAGLQSGAAEVLLLAARTGACLVPSHLLMLMMWVREAQALLL